METAFTIAWWVWAPIAAWMTRAIVVRLFRNIGAWSYGLAYAFWILSFLLVLWFVSWTGMQMYGFDGNDPWQVAGWFVLVFSPFGLPLLVGAPLVLLIDAVRFGWAMRSRHPGRPTISLH